ncbi:LOW QUALITY PROTEIN: calpain-14 [Sceloporus undulatus]|uniref:LOW QUALITY PROTEIN: calpain-14 n=1 Tax=Sceloporus undulatus TaxID=8520 RepID=UPI001C4C3B22|nr:LOW QUALITY PROTEIN: calpain-14 [Sceloporus undulatus]
MPFLKLPWWHQQRKTSWKPKALGRRGTFQKPGSLGQQNYHTLLENCLKKGCLFEDEFFPADDKSIGTGPFLQELYSKNQMIQWKRPHELCKTPVFFSANKKRRVLCQGMNLDCWFLAAVEAITFHQDILFRIVPQNQSFEKKKYAGIFHFKFWHFGEWVDVVVDDRLPINETGNLIFLSSVYKSLFWGALLEKAYAKLCGSYEDLQIGYVSEALVDFTGGVNITIKLAEAPPDLWEILTRATYSRSLMGCQTCRPIRVLGNGLVSSHAYTVTGIRKVTCKHGPENLVRLRNPWGGTEWKGDWSDNSGKWELLNPKEKMLLRRDFEDGEFWMSLQDFQTHFVDLMICKLTPDLMSQEDGKKWMCSMQSGKWVKGSTAGGRMSAHKDTFSMNPQYLLKVLQGNGSKRSFYSCSVLISLIQKRNNKHRNRMPHLNIGLSVYKLGQEYYNSNQKLPSTFFACNRPLNWSLFVNEREVTQDFRLPPGSYVIVPSTSEPHQESEFLLRVFSRKHTLHELGGDSSCVLSKEIVDKHEDWEDYFANYFVQYPEINAVQLQRILNNVSWTSLQNYGLRFRMDTCQSILALLDLNSTGTLSLQEFRILWKKLLLYQDIFQKRDIHQTGTLEQAELHAAVQDIGISLSNELCRLLVFRYGDPHLKITFDSFAYFVLRLEFMMEAFHNMSKDGKGIYLQESEWMMMTLYS